MPFSFHVDEGKGVFHVRASGEVNDSHLIDLASRLRRETAYVAGNPILCDCSAVTKVSISSSLIESLAKAARSRTNFVAVVAPNAVAFGLARMYQIFSDPEDVRIHVFARAKEATAWLDARVERLTQIAQGADGETLRKALEAKREDLNPKPIWHCADCWSIGLMEIASAIPAAPSISALPSPSTTGTRRAVKSSHRVSSRPIKALRRRT